MAPPRRPPSLLTQPAWLASHVSKHGRRGLEAALAERDLRLVHHGVLVALHDFGALSQQQLAESLDLNKSHLVRPVDELENAGYLTRTSDPSDRRRNRVTLTDAGRALVADLGRAEHESQQQLLQALSEDERQVLMELLRRVLDANDQAD